MPVLDKQVVFKKLNSVIEISLTMHISDDGVTGAKANTSISGNAAKTSCTNSTSSDCNAASNTDCILVQWSLTAEFTTYFTHKVTCLLFHVIAHLMYLLKILCWSFSRVLITVGRLVWFCVGLFFQLGSNTVQVVDRFLVTVNLTAATKQTTD